MLQDSDVSFFFFLWKVLFSHLFSHSISMSWKSVTYTRGRRHEHDKFRPAPKQLKLGPGKSWLNRGVTKRFRKQRRELKQSCWWSPSFQTQFLSAMRVQRPSNKNTMFERLKRSYGFQGGKWKRRQSHRGRGVGLEEAHQRSLVWISPRGLALQCGARVIKNSTRRSDALGRLWLRCGEQIGEGTEAHEPEWKMALLSTEQGWGCLAECQSGYYRVATYTGHPLEQPGRGD